MRGRSIYFTAEEIFIMNKLLKDDFDMYFFRENKKENKNMYEYLLHNRMWLILKKFSICEGALGKSIYFSYCEILFMSRFFVSIDAFFCDSSLKEAFIKFAGGTFNKFLLCFSKYYDTSFLYPLRKDTFFVQETSDSS